MDRNLIETFAAGGDDLRAAIAGLTPDEMSVRVQPGIWSIHEVILHIADSDAIAIDRMKRILTEDNPTLLAADETAYIEHLYRAEQSLEDALLLIEINRRQFARVLRKLPDEALARRGTHNIAGEVTVADLVKSYTDHLHHHMQFILDKRVTLGKPDA